MHLIHTRLAALALAAATLVPSFVALAAKTYQVTGTVVKVTDKTITIEKADGATKEKWEIDRDENTKVKGKLKEGEKVTIEYKMTATSVEVK